MIVDLLLNVLKHDIVRQQLGNVLRILVIIIFVLDVEELLVQVEEHLARVHVGAEVGDVFLV